MRVVAYMAMTKILKLLVTFYFATVFIITATAGPPLNLTEN